MLLFNGHIESSSVWIFDKEKLCVTHHWVSLCCVLCNIPDHEGLLLQVIKHQTKIAMFPQSKWSPTVPWKQEICPVYPLTWLEILGCNQDTGFSLERLETCYKWAACGEKLISHINQFDCNSAFDVGQEFLVLMSRTMPSPLTSNGLSALIFWAYMVFVWHAP